MTPALFQLAQSSTANRESLGIIIGLTVIVVAAVIAAIIGFVVWRRYMHEDEPATRVTTAFTLADLRNFHREGQLSDEEFERARSAIIAKTRAVLGSGGGAGAAAEGGDDRSEPGADKPGDDDELNHSS